MRIVIARRLGRRGEGLGNELLPWAKGFLASQVLGAKLIGVSWGLNRRGYWKHFRTNRLDFLWEGLLSLLPTHDFTEADYQQSGEIDFGKAVLAWAANSKLIGRRFLIVRVGGMYGGYSAIARAKPFLLSKLLASRDALPNLVRAQAGFDPARLLVAVHVRGGDFTEMPEDKSIRGQFCVRLPFFWFDRICESLRDQVGDKVQFWFCTDQQTPEYQALVQKYNPNQFGGQGLMECSDLLILASADLRICSVSSYSLAACFLGSGPFIWCKDQLQLINGAYSIWGNEPMQAAENGPTRVNSEFANEQAADGELHLVRGYPIGLEGILPAALIRHLNSLREMRDPRTDLIYYGAVHETSL